MGLMGEDQILERSEQQTIYYASCVGVVNTRDFLLNNLGLLPQNVSL